MEDNYTDLQPINPPETFRKQLQLNIYMDNRKKLGEILVMAINEGQIARFLFSYHLSTLTIKLNIQKKLAFLAFKTNMNIMDEIVLLALVH